MNARRWTLIGIMFPLQAAVILISASLAGRATVANLAWVFGWVFAWMAAFAVLAETGVLDRFYAWLDRHPLAGRKTRNRRAP
jgi:hypothetical protein